MGKVGQITNLPPELLTQVLSHLDDKSNVLVATVSKCFKDIVDRVVKTRYNGSQPANWYQIEIFGSSVENSRQEMEQHRLFILRRVSAIKLKLHVELDTQKHWIYKVIGMVGGEIKKIRLETDKEISLNFRTILSKTPELTHFEMCQTKFFDDYEFRAFVRNSNCRLESVKLEILDYRVVYAFDRSKIDSLSCLPRYDTPENIPVLMQTQPMQMAYLTRMHLTVPKRALNECITKIVEPCPNLKYLTLVHLDNINDILKEASMSVLCNLRSMLEFDASFYMSLPNVLRLIDNLPALKSMTLAYRTFTIDDFTKLLAEANRHDRLRCIHFKYMDLYDDSLLDWLMKNVKQIRVHFFSFKKFAVCDGRVLFDGITIMSSDESPIEYWNMNEKWFQQIDEAVDSNDDFFDLFSSFSIPLLIRVRIYIRQKTDLHLNDATDEAVMRRRGGHILSAKTSLSSNYEKSKTNIDWLEKYCFRLRQLSILIEYNHPQFPKWSFPDVTVLQIRHKIGSILDLSFLTSLQRLSLTSFKLDGRRPVTLINTQVVRDINLFDNLVTLQIIHFNESTIYLLEQFNKTVQKSLRHLTLANRRVDGQRYKMNTKAISAISRYRELVQLTLILPGINETNTKYLLENCGKLTELRFECNFLTAVDAEHSYWYDSCHTFADIQSNGVSLKRLILVWHDCMMDHRRVNGIKNIFPDIVVKISQMNEEFVTTAEQELIGEGNDNLEQFVDKW